MNSEFFEQDINRHEMQVLHDAGVNRHLRFRRPGTMTMHFDILTWPGYLCYTGDMGTFVFRRTLDMFDFFRPGKNDKPYQIDFRYWAEKLEAADKVDGVSSFSPDRFKAEVKEYFEEATSDEDKWPQARKAALWGEIESNILNRVDYEGEGGAWTALRDFSHDGFEFRDWERSCKEYSHRFLWCCHALEWAVRTYDESCKEEAVERPRG